MACNVETVLLNTISSARIAAPARPRRRCEFRDFDLEAFGLEEPCLSAMTAPSDSENGSRPSRIFSCAIAAGRGSENAEQDQLNTSTLDAFERQPRRSPPLPFTGVASPASAFCSVNGAGRRAAPIRDQAARRADRSQGTQRLCGRLRTPSNDGASRTPGHRSGRCGEARSFRTKPRRADLLPTILVFDSGLGGLTVFREVVKARPDARFLYVADDAFLPL